MNRFYFSFQTGLFLLFFFCAGVLVPAQSLQVTSGSNLPYTPQNLISNIFLGEGVEVTSITYGGDPDAVGYFNNGTTAVGIERGIVLTSGVAETSGFSLGCNEVGSDFASTDHLINTSDVNLQTIATAPLHDLAVYTIKFIPTSDTLRFRYCFASEEYPEYACSSFNDVFGFFIQGPGYPTPTNIAKVPGTNLA
ncbi:MAG: choice-of-anchor L domain-containing protein, partial [Saprospiraceae bacterium]